MSRTVATEEAAVAKAGWCAQCGAYVWLAEGGGCVNGHAADQMSNVYEAAEQKDSLDRAGDELGKAADQVSVAATKAWNDAQPGLQKAGDDLGKAADQAADKAKELGGKIWAWGQKQAKSNQDTGSDFSSSDE